MSELKLLAKDTAGSNSAIRIHFVADGWVPSRAASSIAAMKMAAAFARLGHDVTLLARHGGGCEAPFARYGVPPTFRILRARRPSSRLHDKLGYLARIRGLAMDEPAPDLLYARDALCLAALGDRALNLAFEAHQLPDDRAHRALLGWLFRRPRFGALVTISDGLRRDYLRHFARSLDPARVVVAHDAADPPPSGEAAASPPCWRGRPGALQVGYVGHLYPGKGIATVLDLARTMPAVDFHLVGGRDEDLATWRREGREIPNLHLHGFVPQPEVAGYLARFDVAIAPFKRRLSLAGGSGDIARWTSPLKLFEYMAAGKPIVCSDLPVLREVLDDGGTALLCRPDDLDDWRRALLRLHDPGLRARLGDAARRRFEERHTWEQRARHILGALGAVASRSAVSGSGRLELQRAPGP